MPDNAASDRAVRLMVEECTRGLSAITDRADLIVWLLETTIQITGARRALFSMADPRSPVCYSLAPDARSEIARFAPWAGCLGQTVLAENRVQYWSTLVPGCGTWPGGCPVADAPSSYVGVPLRVGDRIIGVLGALDLAAPENERQQVALLEAVGDEAARLFARLGV